MRKRFFIPALIVLVCFLCCGCGSRKAKYLDPAGREKLESRLLEDLHFACSEGDSVQAMLRLENNTGYDLHDVSIRWAANDEYIAWISSFPAGTRARLALSTDRPWKEKVQSAGGQFRLEYVVGAYRYVTQPIDMQLESAEAISNMEIYVETGTGRMPLTVGGTTEFATGVEINGLTSARINSLTTKLSPLANGRFQLQIDLKGQAPGGTSSTLSYKLYDSSRIVLDSGIVSFTEDEATLYFSGAGVTEGGQYLLCFAEYH